MTGLGLGLGLRGPDLGLGLDKNCQRTHKETQNVTEQHILSRILKKASKSKFKNSDDKQGFWKSADNLYPQPKSISWKYFPIDHVFSGKWYKDDVFR